MSKSVADVLRRAAALCEGGWCQGAYEQDGAYCAAGAIVAIANQQHDPDLRPWAWQALYRHLGKVGVTEWNDRPERTQAEVVAALRAAADAAEREGTP